MLLIFFYISAIVLNLDQAQSLHLKQVVILSRHNVRTPLSKTLSQVSPKPWPQWKEKTGYLTAKGELLEGFMGEYFSSWLKEEGLLPSECPDEGSFFVYANTAQRTMVSAKSFVKKGFPKCNITVHHANKSDPIFNPYIHNNSAEYIAEALDIMNKQIKSLHLNSSYRMLEEILDYKKSEWCAKKHQCNLATDLNTAFAKTGTKPFVSGPLKISKSAIDSFIMENYEGFSTNDVAWGELETDKKWQTVMEISRGYHNIIFNSTLIAQDLAKPMIKYLTKFFLKESPKVALVMGHDSNIYTVLNAMGFKSYILKDQYEITPIGGKIVFQKWSDDKREFLKLYYVYQGTEQMRDGVKLSLANPPVFYPLELNDCKVDHNGLCSWTDFVTLLSKL